MTKTSNRNKNYKIIKGVKITKAKRKFNAEGMAGSLTDFKLGGASCIRKKAWIREKQFIN